MDYGSLLTIAIIVLYGTLEYRRREHIHRDAMEYLKRGIAPPIPLQGVSGWRLMTTASVGILLAILAGFLVYRGMTLPRYGTGVAVIGMIFAVLVVPVVIMFVRDWKIHRSSAHGG